MESKIRQIITQLNVATSSNIEHEKHEELKAIYKQLLTYAEIEEELGIDLITLAKIQREGVYVKEHIDLELEDSFDYSYFPPKLIRVDFKEKKLLLYFEDIYEICYLLDFNRYGKQFALTKEELEVGKYGK